MGFCLIELNGGSVNLNIIKFDSDNIVTTSKSIFSMNGGSFTSDYMNINDISLNSGNGGGMKIEEERIRLKKSSFSWRKIMNIIYSFY